MGTFMHKSSCIVCQSLAELGYHFKQITWPHHMFFARQKMVLRGRCSVFIKNLDNVFN